MKLVKLGSVLVGSALLLAACGGGDDGGGGSSGGSALQVTAPVNAANDGFSETALTTPADVAFTISFDNQDEGIPHNVQIFEGTSTTGSPVWTPADNAMITAPATADYEIPALAAGTYTFNCFSHPTTMVGTLTVE
jgi:plastocyanin